ncbi:uncharacterized protein ACWYII_018814 isoform 1-T1 [Salvelinus alpinus]
MGIQGLPGDQGLPGIQRGKLESLVPKEGETGLRGSKGEKGVSGDTGARGPEGRKGDVGLMGAAGPCASPGQDGLPGKSGELGYPGKPGKPPTDDHLMKLCANVLPSMFPAIFFMHDYYLLYGLLKI